MKRLGAALAILLAAALYLTNLSAMGMVGPDEPRYAFIGRAMAQTGDWITPRLWGSPWFEKPAFLYWITAIGFRLGLGPELAPRLPVALLSVSFLVFFWWRLRVEWDERVAWYASAMLATSAGWLAYSHVAVTDLPLAALFSAAVLLSLPYIARGERALLPFAAACLGLAALDKGLVPLVLFLPVIAMRWRDWFRPAPLAAFAVCALPWYILCTLQNGAEFFRVFFLQQQFSRFSSGALQHVQPFWFYVPAGLLLLFPWFPLVGLARGKWSDPRVRVLAYVALFGFLFFSASVNKLPSYVLPLEPVFLTLVAVGLSQQKRAAWWLAVPVLLCSVLPALPEVVAFSLSRGLSNSTSAYVDSQWVSLAAMVLVAVAVGVAASFLPQDAAFAIVTVVISAGFLWFEQKTFPLIDTYASSRPRWLAYHPKCSSGETRNLAYGLYYYSESRLPNCEILDQNGTPGVR